MSDNEQMLDGQEEMDDLEMAERKIRQPWWNPLQPVEVADERYYING